MRWYRTDALPPHVLYFGTANVPLDDAASALHNGCMDTANAQNTTKDPSQWQPKRGLRAKLFARAMAQAGDVHDQLIEPYKRRLLTPLRGDVLEIGPGSGVNFEYFAPDTRWMGIEPNPYMTPYLQESAAKQGRTIDLRAGYTEALPVESESMDAVVSTLVLCSVKDMQRSLAEIRRVLKPGGKYVFIEHVAAPTGSGLRWRQNTIRPLWSFFADGCQPNREIWQELAAAGFHDLEIEHFAIQVPIVRPHIAGFAIK